MSNLRLLPPSRIGHLLDPAWRAYPHLLEVEELVLQLYENKFDNLAIQLPIRHGKSLFAISIVAFWLLIHYPEERIIITSFSKDAAKECLCKARDALLAYGGQLNNVHIDPNNCRSDYFKIANNIGECRAVSIGTKFSHATANTILIDDIYTEESAKSPVQRKSIEDWFFGTLLNRRTPSARGPAKCISCQTPRYPSDVQALLLKKNKESKDKWVFIKKPCISEEGEPLWSQQFPLSKLKVIRQDFENEGKSYMWLTQWMCDATSDPTAIEFPASYFEDIFYKDNLNINVRNSFGAVDPATGRGESGDYSAAVYMLEDQNGVRYVDDSIMVRCPISEFEQLCCEFWYKHNPDAQLIEINVESGFAQHLPKICYEKHDLQLYLNVVHHTDDKEIRIRKYLSTLLYQKKLKFRDTQSNRLIVSQMGELFSGAHDDGPDAVAMACEMADTFYGKK